MDFDVKLYGEYADLPMTDYHMDDGAISKTGLCHVLDRPSVYDYKKKKNVEDPKKPTAAMALGTVVHCLVLEPEEFEKRYVMVDTASKISKVYKEAVESEKGRLVLTKPECDVAKMMASSLSNSQALQKIFALGGKSEVSFFWEDDGVVAKCRPDWVSDGGSIIVDVKTARDASPAAFGKSSFDLKYPLSAFMTCTGVAEVRQTHELGSYIFAVVESQPPYDTGFYHVDPGSFPWSLGEKWYLEGMAKFRECRTQNRWPGLSPKILPLQLPRYAF